ncbi:MAG: carbon storage regulator CsrA [Vulcanimicrobiota bacterium]
MLVLTRKINQSIVIGNDVKITILDIKKEGLVSIGISAPKNVSVYRQEIYDEIQRENLASSMVDESSIAQFSEALKKSEFHKPQKS